MITPNTFREWLGLATPGEPGVKAVGLLQLEKLTGFENQAFDIPKNSLFVTQGLGFTNPEPWGLSQSRTTPLSIAVEARTTGPRFNVSRDSVWDFFLQGLKITNPQAFTLGKDETPEKPGLFPSSQKLGPSDNLLQFHLDTGIAICRRMMSLKADDPFPEEDPLVRQACFLFSMYKYENVSTQQKEIPQPSSQPTNPQVQSYFRSQVYMPILRQMKGLLAHRINFKYQILGRTEDEAA